MMDRRHIETILRMNGLGKTAPDEEIRSVLMSARFTNEDVDTALMVLRENVVTKETNVSGLHKIFRSDQTLKSSEIIKLLGINVDLDKKVVVGRKSRELRVLQIITLWLASVVLALVAIVVYMYFYEFGLFHDEKAAVFKNEHRQ